MIKLLLLLSSFALAELPDWVQEPDKACKKTEICVIGEATGLNMAQANARNEIAKFFKTRVVSTFQVTTVSDNKTTDEFVNEGLQEMTDEVLEGVEVKKTFEGKESIYVFAVLDKRAAWKKLASAIRSLDEKMQVLMDSAERSSIFKLKKFYNERETLNVRYEFLRGSRLMEKTTFKDIVEKQRKMTKGILIAVQLNEKKMAHFLKEILTQAGFRIVKKEGSHQIKGSYQSEKQHLNVDGFEKHKFTLILNAVNSKNQTTGTLIHDVSTTGRDFTQAYNAAFVKMKEYISEHIDQLNIK